MYHIHQLRRVKVGSLSHYGLMHPRWLFGILPARNSPFHPRRARSSRPRQWRAQHDLRHPSLLARLPSWRVNIWAGLVFYMPKFPSQTQGNLIPSSNQNRAHLSHSFHGNPMGMRTVLVWQPDSLTMSHLETLLKFSTILGATDQRTHIQGNDTAILDGYPVTHNQDAHPAKWVGRIFWDDSEKGAFEHNFGANFRTNPTPPSGLQEHPWWRPVGPGPPRWLSCPHQDLQPWHWWLGWSEIIVQLWGYLETKINQTDIYIYIYG